MQWVICYYDYEARLQEAHLPPSEDQGLSMMFGCLEVDVELVEAHVLGLFPDSARMVAVTSPAGRTVTR